MFSQVDISASLQQLHRSGIARAVARVVQRRFPTIILPINRSSRRKKGRRAVYGWHGGCREEGRHAIAIEYVDVGAARKEQFHTLHRIGYV